MSEALVIKKSKMINFIDILRLIRQCFYSCIFETFFLIFNTDVHFLYMSRTEMLHGLFQGVSLWRKLEGTPHLPSLTCKGPDLGMNEVHSETAR